jgi:hypothetical protein
MTLAALHDARALGSRVGITHASPIGAGFHADLGYKAYCKLAMYMPKD